MRVSMLTLYNNQKNLETKKNELTENSTSVQKIVRYIKNQNCFTTTEKNHFRFFESFK